MPERDQLTFWNYIEREMLKLSPGYEFTNYKDQFGTLRIVPVQIVKKLPVSELTQEQFISSVERTAEYPRFAEKLIHEQLLNYHDGNS